MLSHHSAETAFVPEHSAQDLAPEGINLYIKRKPQQWQEDSWPTAHLECDGGRFPSCLSWNVHQLHQSVGLFQGAFTAFGNENPDNFASDNQF